MADFDPDVFVAKRKQGAAKPFDPDVFLEKRGRVAEPVLAGEPAKDESNGEKGAPSHAVAPVERREEQVGDSPTSPTGEPPAAVSQADEGFVAGDAKRMSFAPGELSKKEERQFQVDSELAKIGRERRDEAGEFWTPSSVGFLFPMVESAGRFGSHVLVGGLRALWTGAQAMEDALKDRVEGLVAGGSRSLHTVGDMLLDPTMAGRLVGPLRDSAASVLDKMQNPDAPDEAESDRIRREASARGVKVEKILEERKKAIEAKKRVSSGGAGSPGLDPTWPVSL